MNLNKTTNETDAQYHKRLIYGKLVDRDLQDVSYAELSEKVYGQPYSNDVARRMMYGSCKTLQLLDSDRLDEIADQEILSDLDMRTIELQKEQQRLRDQRAAYNRLIRSEARRDEMMEIIKDAVHSGDLPALEQRRCYTEDADENTLLVSMNDIHYGASYENHWGIYNSMVFEKQLQYYLDRVLEIQKTHKSKRCIVWANGDLISGFIHKSIQVSNKENCIQQVMGVAELLSCFLAKLSEHFEYVGFTSVAGNHSRLEKADDASINERLDDLVEWYLVARLQDFGNVTVGASAKIDSTMFILNVHGLNYIGVHGDYDTSTDKIQSLRAFAGRPVYAILMGHMHHNKTDSVSGIKTFMAGSFLGMDEYAISRRLYGKPEQLVLVCDQYGVRCQYDISLDGETINNRK